MKCEDCQYNYIHLVGEDDVSQECEAPELECPYKEKEGTVINDRK